MRKEDKGGGIMERLTIDEVIEHCKRTTEKYENLNGINTLETADISLSFIKEYWEHYQVRAWLKELKQYKNLEEQGLLLRFPVQVGDTILYVDSDDDNYPIEAKITRIEIKETYILYCAEEKEDCETLGFDSDDIGKTVFLTKAEAEQKLKGMESD